MTTLGERLDCSVVRRVLRESGAVPDPDKDGVAKIHQAFLDYANEYAAVFRTNNAAANAPCGMPCEEAYEERREVHSQSALRYFRPYGRIFFRTAILT